MSAAIEIVNLRHTVQTEPYDFRVDRCSSLGNPYPLETEADRDKVCDQYQEWFDEQLRMGNRRVLAYLARMELALKVYGRLRLFCWCVPKRCHVETVRNYLEARRAGR